MPIKVMPICTVDKNVFGFLGGWYYFLALALPFVAKFSSLNFFADTNAISLIEKMPFNNISKNRTNISM